MLKQKLGLVLGVATLALASMPVFASAAELTGEGGPTATGSEIWATSTDFRTVSAIGEFDCEHVEVGGEVVSNSGGTVTVGEHAELEGMAEGCVRRTPLGEELLDVTIDFRHLHLGGTSTLSLTYVVHFPNLGLSCHFEGVVPASAVAEGTVLQVEGVISGTSPEPCVKGANFRATFSLANANGPVSID